ncbi:Inward rectifier potassium channel [Synechococcus sp. PCC 7502]|uniref:ion channel n=1 Tax=Synechococcus sp. PCC 7502 TaxID=1173263 RepID=UPI00029FF789|nr:ion channel [Synechococcus sp. PCC 7502]AFY73067.1 Inward rectifier potassium channel [Synechococcus sp. PCC 7502]
MASVHKSQPPNLRPRLVKRRQSPALNVIRLGSEHSYWRDIYHLLLTIHWLWLVSLICVGYVAINAGFALLYLAGGDCLKNAVPNSFGDAFFFSVQTMATIGYGSIYPSTVYANVIVVVEALVGLITVAMATGLMFARFARPTSRILFSQVAVITNYNGLPTLMFRAANERQNTILEAKLWAVLLRDEISDEGSTMRRFYDLKLTRSQTPIFSLTWMAMHIIDETSPLHGFTTQTLQEVDAEIIVTLTGIDETFAQTIYARHSFICDEIAWNMRFVDILAKLPDGGRSIDYRLFHQITPAATKI